METAAVLNNATRRGLAQQLARPTNGASLGVFRIAVGVVMALEALYLCRPYPGAISTGLTPLATYYTGQDVTFHFPYAGFEWLPVLSVKGFYGVVALLAISGITTALGLFYRASITVVFLSWGYLFAIESTRTYWQSHFYLELLVVFLLIWMPASRRYSIDALIARARHVKWTCDVPIWTVYLLRAQLVIAYFYAGFAKLNADWLLDAVPIRWILARAADKPIFDAHAHVIRSMIQSVPLAYCMAYLGASFDLLIGWLLLARRTRAFGLALLVIFHVTNHFLFDDIGLFPLLGLLTATIFLDPAWPERFGRWIHGPRLPRPDWGWAIGGFLLFPGVGAALGWKGQADEIGEANENRSALWPIVATFFIGWIVLQTLIPLRQYLIAGDARFTYEGLSFSWRLKTDTRHAFGHQLFVKDSALLVDRNLGPLRVDWKQWHGERVVYRELTPGSIDWSRLPQILVTLDPVVGEEVLFNPAGADSTGPAAKGSANVRAAAAWMRAYDHAPAKVSAASLPGANGATGAAPLVRIEDPAVISMAGGVGRVNRERWRQGDFTRDARHPLDLDSIVEPMVIYFTTIGWEARERLPAWVIMDVDAHPDWSPRIYWNSYRDLNASKFLHVSNQPFYLQRYACRVADQWEREYGRCPRVQAITAVSLNGRPHQYLVDPSADLAGVRVRWLSHNDWIVDLKTDRIPQSALATKGEL